MATSPEGKKYAVAYPGGSVTAPLANLELLFGTLHPVWGDSPGVLPSGRRRRYRSRQASNASAGESMAVHFSSGEVWHYRVTGPHLDFISQVLHRASAATVEAIYSERGTEYLKEVPALTGP